MIQQQDADRYVGIGKVTTAPGARTGLFVPIERTLYVAVPAQPSARAEIRAYTVE